MKKPERIYSLLFLTLACAGLQTRADDDCDSCDDSCATDTTSCCQGGHYTSKTHFQPIDFYQSGSYLRHALSRNDRMTASEDGFGGAFNVTPFGGQTTDSGQEELGRYFGKNHKRCLKVAESASNHPDADLDANHFNIRTNGGDFVSNICICPEQEHVGVGLSYRQIIQRNEDDSARFWFEVGAPVVHVENNMHFSESIENDGNGIDPQRSGLDGADPVANMKEAFGQSNWKYGKIAGLSSDASCDDDCDDNQDETELGNVELKIGFNSVVGDCAHLGSYLGVVTPSTQDSEDQAKFLFAPQVGYDHWGLMHGYELGFKVGDYEMGSLHAKMNIDARYMFENEELRMFDLVDKQWSRYMEMYKDKEEAEANQGNVDTGTSGINLMTRCVDVEPGYQFNMNTGLVFEGCKFNVELGHTLYARQAEEICPNWQEGPVLKASGGTGQITVGRTVAQPFGGTNQDLTDESYENLKIRTCDVDWNSASHPAVVAHSIYGSLGMQWDDMCYPVAVSIGGAYDFNSSNTAMERWTVFGKFDVSF